MEELQFYNVNSGFLHQENLTGKQNEFRLAQSTQSTQQ